MGNRKGNLKNSSQEETKQPANRSKTGKDTTDGPALARKAVKAVAAVALGVGGVLSIARRRTRTKNPSPDSKVPEQQAFMTPELTTSAATPERVPSSQELDRDAIALRAYYLSEERRAAGLPADPRRDWLDAERELRGETSVDYVT